MSSGAAAAGSSGHRRDSEGLGKIQNKLKKSLYSIAPLFLLLPFKGGAHSFGSCAYGRNENLAARAP